LLLLLAKVLLFEINSINTEAAAAAAAKKQQQQQQRGVQIMSVQGHAAHSATLFEAMLCEAMLFEAPRPATLDAASVVPVRSYV
jgi:hypothetical protein